MWHAARHVLTCFVPGLMERHYHRLQLPYTKDYLLAATPPEPSIGYPPQRRLRKPAGSNRPRRPCGGRTSCEQGEAHAAAFRTQQANVLEARRVAE